MRILWTLTFGCLFILPAQYAANGRYGSGSNNYQRAPDYDNYRDNDRNSFSSNDYRSNRPPNNGREYDGRDRPNFSYSNRSYSDGRGSYSRPKSTHMTAYTANNCPIDLECPALPAIPPCPTIPTPPSCPVPPACPEVTCPQCPVCPKCTCPECPTCPECDCDGGLAEMLSLLICNLMSPGIAFSELCFKQLLEIILGFLKELKGLKPGGNAKISGSPTFAINGAGGGQRGVNGARVQLAGTGEGGQRGRETGQRGRETGQRTQNAGNGQGTQLVANGERSQLGENVQDSQRGESGISDFNNLLESFSTRGMREFMSLAGMPSSAAQSSSSSSSSPTLLNLLGGLSSGTAQSPSSSSPSLLSLFSLGSSTRSASVPSEEPVPVMKTAYTQEVPTVDDCPNDYYKSGSKVLCFFETEPVNVTAGKAFMLLNTP